MSPLSQLRSDINRHKDPKKAIILQRFFKTKKGEYAEGDIFVGLVVPVSRALANQHGPSLSESDIARLISSPIHEERLIALLVLVGRFQKGTPAEQARVYRFYMKHLDGVNNWDLVDLSAHHIVGGYVFKHSHTPLFTLARSNNLWRRRIAMVATFYYIKQFSFDIPLAIAEQLLHDGHDLIHKAVGWMLREIGKRDLIIEQQFLNKYAATMPRTMLRYAIERMDPTTRSHYMNVKSSS